MPKKSDAKVTKRYQTCQSCKKAVRQDRFKNHKCKIPKLDQKFLCDVCQPAMYISKKNKARHIKLHRKKKEQKI